MLEQRLEAVEPAWQPAVAPAFRWSELLNHQEVVALLFLLPALAVLAFGAVYPFSSAVWISVHHKTAGVPAQFFRQLPGAVR